jgi:hypothetical protein
MVKLLTVLYRVLLLVVLCVIAFHAHLIYERMPLTFGEWFKTKHDPVNRRELVAKPNACGQHPEPSSLNDRRAPRRQQTVEHGRCSEVPEEAAQVEV